MQFLFCFFTALTVLVGCVSTPSHDFTVNKDSVEPGSSVSVQGEKVELYDGNFKLGDDFTEVAKGVILPIKGQVAVISIVPSIDTAVCETQTHLLGESALLSPKVKRFTVSRDLPMAQQRFASAADLKNIQYVSDYKTGSFGKSTGLMMKGKELLARSVIVTDQEGIVRFYQIVPEATNLPDMREAFEVANSLVKP